MIACEQGRSWAGWSGERASEVASKEGKGREGCEIYPRLVLTVDPPVTIDLREAAAAACPIWLCESRRPREPFGARCLSSRTVRLCQGYPEAKKPPPAC